MSIDVGSSFDSQRIKSRDGVPLLETRYLEVTYNHVSVAVQAVSVSVCDGEITAILGSNGAGKTTTVRAMSGFLQSDNAEITDGEVLFEGRKLNGRPPHTIANGGLALVPERDKVFPALTVADNLKAVPARGSAAARREMRDLVFELFPVLAERNSQVAGYLSGGERQMLGIARALMLQSRLLIADELSLGIAPSAVSRLMDALVRLNKERGTTIVLVEQNILAALSVADYAYVMETGRVVLDGTPQRLMEHEDIREFYLGLGDEGQKSYADVKQYRRRRRWWG